MGGVATRADVVRDVCHVDVCVLPERALDPPARPVVQQALAELRVVRRGMTAVTSVVGRGQRDHVALQARGISRSQHSTTSSGDRRLQFRPPLARACARSGRPRRAPPASRWRRGQAVRDRLQGGSVELVDQHDHVVHPAGRRAARPGGPPRRAAAGGRRRDGRAPASRGRSGTAGAPGGAEHRPAVGHRSSGVREWATGTITITSRSSRSYAREEAGHRWPRRRCRGRSAAGSHRGRRRATRLRSALVRAGSSSRCTAIVRSHRIVRAYCSAWTVLGSRSSTSRMRSAARPPGGVKAARSRSSSRVSRSY